jgi:hypothetical protein
MANRRFIDFPIAASVGDNDIVLIWQDGMNKQTTKGTLIQGAPTSLEGLTDVDIAGLINGQILQYNSTLGKWENVDRTDINLSELGDVSIVSPTNGQVLVYNSSTSKWENSSGGYVPYTGAVTTVNLGAQSILAGSFVKAGGTSSQFLKADGSVDSNTYLTTGNAAATYVPYTGATADVNLGTHDLAAERGTFQNNGSSDTLTVNHTSGSGYGIIVTKGGNNEALYVSKTSGSGNAMTVVGGRTSLVDLSLSSVTNTAGDFLTLSGGVVHKRTAAETLTDIGGQAALTNPVTGTGTTNYLPKFTGSTTIGNSQVFDNGTNVGINQAIPTRTLDILGASGIGTVLKLQGASGTTTYLQLAYNGATNAQSGYIGYNSSSQLQFFTNDTLALTIDSSRNLGLGVTPSAWNSAYKVIQINNQAAFWGASDQAIVSLNQFQNTSGSNRYIANGFASQYRQDGGQHQFYTAPSGTAGNAISFTQAMTITSGGNLLVGTTSDAGYRLDVNGTGRFSGQTSVLYNGYDSNVEGLRLGFDTSYYHAISATFSSSAVNNKMNFVVNSGNGTRGIAMTLQGNGNVGIGTASPSGKLHLSSTGDTYLVMTGGASPRTYSFLVDATNLRLFSGVGDTTLLTIASTGASTFTSSLRATEITAAMPSGNGALYINNSSLSNKNWTFIPQTSSSETDLLLFYTGASAGTRLTITSGGNVLIGTATSGSSKLRIVGLPTSAAGLSSGDVYNLSGVLMIA